MIIDWTAESIIASVCIMLVFLLSAYWVNKLLRIALLLLGFLGIWLAIVDPYVKIEKDMQTSEVSDILSFLVSAQAEQTDTIKLIGSDYDIEELGLLSDYQIKHLEIGEDPGFSEIAIPDVLEGKSFHISGKFNGDIDQRGVLWLETPDKREVEGTIESNGYFEIESVAPVKGLYEYKINTILKESDTLSEVLAIEVLPTSKLNMMIMAESPQFELNYLKNYWVSQGHAIVQRVKISQDKYNTSFVNMDEFPISKVNRKLLDRFDILFVDFKTWNSYSAAERGNVLAAVSERGLGLILKPSKEGEVAAGMPRHRIARFTEIEDAGTSVNVAVLEHNSIWLEDQNTIMHQKGFGQVLIPKISDTYRYILNDQSTRYQKIWSDIFSNLYVKINQDFAISTPFLATQGAKTEVKMSNIQQNEILLHNEKDQLVTNFTPLLDGYGEAKIIPVAGWNKIARENAEEGQWFYAHDSTAWKSMRQLEVNRYIEKLTYKNSKVQTPTKYFVNKRLPFYISLLLVIVGFGTVWFLEKIT